MNRRMYRVKLGIICTFLAASLSTSTSFANWYQDNPWYPVDRRADPFYNAIGVIEMKNAVWVEGAGRKGKGQANAWLVSPCYAITNNHAVFGDEFPDQPRTEQEREAISQKYAVTFRVGVGRTLPFAGSVTALPVRWGRRDYSSNDWALLRLNSCLGTRPEIGWMPVDVNLIGSVLYKNTTMIKVVFFDVQTSLSEGSEKLPDSYPMYESLGCVYGYNELDRVFRYSASTKPGTSGAPIMRRGEDGLERVIGIHRGGGVDFQGSIYNKYYKTYSPDIANQFLNIRDIIDSQDVRKLLVADMLAYGKGEPYGRDNAVRPPIVRQGAKPCAQKEPD